MKAGEKWSKKFAMLDKLVRERKVQEKKRKVEKIRKNFSKVLKVGPEVWERF